jgi:hypothetical protein
MILKLGKKYKVKVILSNRMALVSELKFIKVTQKGYNFLNEKSNKCVFRHHFYPINRCSKYYRGDMSFFIPNKIIINETIKNEIPN